MVQMRLAGQTLRAIGSAFGITRERVRQILQGQASPVPPLSESRVAKAIGCSTSRLQKLRVEGIIRPERLKGCWRYSDDELEKARIALQRSCPHCGVELLVSHRGKYCFKCRELSRKCRYSFLDEEGRRRFRQATRRWKERHLQQWRAIQRRALAKYQERKRLEHYAVTEYIVIHRTVLPLGAVFKAVDTRRGRLVLSNGVTVPFRCVRKVTRVDSKY